MTKKNKPGPKPHVIFTDKYSLLQALEVHGNSPKKLAESIGYSKAQVFNWMNRLGIKGTKKQTYS